MAVRKPEKRLSALAETLRHPLFLLVALAFVCLAPGSPCSAQMFGPRVFGRPLSRSNPSSTTEVGNVRGNERFLRRNRRATDFVGGDSQTAGTFVGSQSTGRRSIRSATDSLRPARSASANINQPLGRMPATGMYPPKLVLSAEDLAVTRRPVTGETLRRHLSGLVARHPDNEISVSVVGGKAVLRGVVASESYRVLAQRILSFEPGLDSIRNELRVGSIRADRGRRQTERILPEPTD